MIRLEVGAHQWDWKTVPARCVWCRVSQATVDSPDCERLWLEEGSEPSPEPPRRARRLWRRS